MRIIDFLPPFKDLRSELEDIAAECKANYHSFDYDCLEHQQLVITIWTARELYSLREEFRLRKGLGY